MHEGPIRRPQPAGTTPDHLAAAAQSELAATLNRRSPVRSQQILRNALDASPGVVAQRKLARSLAVGGVVQLAKPGELENKTTVEVDDDGVLMRGEYLGDVEKRFEDEDEVEVLYYGKILVTHANNVAVDEPWEQDYPLGKINKYQNAPVGVKKVPQTGAKFVHFNPVSTTASEYIRPHNVQEGIGAANKIEITNHGFGSGIYGIAGPTSEQYEEAETKYQSKPYPIELQQPLYLQSAQHGTLLTELSKQLQRTAESIRQEFPGLVSHYGVADWVEANPSKLAELAKRLKAVLIPVQAAPPDGVIEDALFDFFFAYNSQELVEQPINFLLKKLGYDGIYADNPSDNSFSRGNVSYGVPQDMRKTAHVDRQK
jgi:hypothetical protein